MVAAAAAVMIAGVLLACWFSGVPAALEFASWRGKTNTCVATLALGVSLLVLLRSPGRIGNGWSRALAGLALSIGAATSFQYLTGLSLGIDELILRDIVSSEFEGLPNRMSPSAAVGFIVVSLGVLLRHSTRPRTNEIAQVFALLAITLSGFALMGYLYSATLLYQPTRFLRISPYTAVSHLLLGVSVLLSQPALGLTRALTRSGIGGYLSRRLLPISVVVPVAVGWLLVKVSKADALTASETHALHAVAVVCALVAMVVFLTRSLNSLEKKRDRAVAQLRLASNLTEGLAQARSVDEVVAVTVSLGGAALDANALSVLQLSADERELKILASRGYPKSMTAAYETFDVDSPFPAAEAARLRQAVFLESPEERAQRYPALPAVLENSAWAALPLEGNRGILGVLAVSYAQARRFDEEERVRLRRLAWQCAQALDRAMLFESEQLARRAAEAASRAKDEFLALLGHELRNPLSPMLTSLQVMKLRAPDVLERERATMERQVQHMRHLIDDLLDVSRITSGRVELRKSRRELDSLVKASLEVSSPLIEKRGHHVSIDVSPELWVDVDPERLVQVISNLLTNAAKYTDPGGRIEIAGVQRDGKVLLSVTDNGIGIPADLLPRLFDLFVQGKRSLARSEGGLGLGLAVVKSITELHGGSVRVESAGIGQGSRFIVELAAAGPADSPLAPPIAPAQPLAVEPQRVLVVDDNRDAADSAAEALSLSGHLVQVAYDGPSALDAAREFKPTIVFLDIGLPVMDGYEVARRLPQCVPQRPTLVAVTGYSQESDRERARAAGFDAHLVKPATIEQKLALVSQYRQATAT